jgi:hypothetical protein
MTRWLVVVVMALVIAAVASQLILPPLTANRIEGRLTDHGGTADVSVSAFPAATLLWGNGDRLSVTGSGINLPLDSSGGTVFDKLDGFDRVDVSLNDFHAGPFAVASFELNRSGSSATYHLVSDASTTPGGLASYGAERLGLPGGGLLGLFADRAFGADQPIPVRIDMTMDSDGGRLVVVSGGGTVAGYPTGPLAELITEAIAVRL